MDIFTYFILLSYLMLQLSINLSSRMKTFYHGPVPVPEVMGESVTVPGLKSVQTENPASQLTLQKRSSGQHSLRPSQG